MLKTLSMLLVSATLALAPGAALARSYHHHRSYADSSDYYTSRDGHRVHRPSEARHAPAGASARCRDGSYSFSRSHRGTCSWHGGVASWL